MEEKIVLKLWKKESLSLAHVCPYCCSTNTTQSQRQIQKNITRNEDHFYMGDKEVYHETAQCKCNDCSKEYSADYGESTYIIYDNPIPVTNTYEIVCLAKYSSRLNYGFGIYATRFPDNMSESIYYIKSERDSFPIFITKSQMEKMLHSCDETRNFVYNIWMTRYR